MELRQIVDTDKFPIQDSGFRAACRADLDSNGVLVMPGFLTQEAIESVKQESQSGLHQAYFCQQSHTAYLSPPDPAFPADHPRNRLVESSKGCITDDQISQGSLLRALYDSAEFQDYLCAVLGEEGLYPYADPLSSINVHYAKTGQELGWHFDNSSFAITLMIQPAVRGGQFEYLGAVRNSDAGDMNFSGVEAILDGKVTAKHLTMDAGALVLFRGRNAIHRVTPNEGERTRILVVLAYNSKPGVSLSEAARLTFYGRTH